MGCEDSMSKKQKILFVSGSLNRGGAQRVIALLADDYVRQGWSVHVAILLYPEIEYEISDQIIIHNIVQHSSQFKNIFKWISHIRRIILMEKPDVIVSFAGRVNLITMMANMGTGIPVLVSERNDPIYDRRSRLEQFLCKYFYSRADKVVFQTEYQREYYKKWCNKNSVIIGNPILAPVYDGPHPKPDIVCVGKLMDQKNHPMMIRAFKMIADEFPERSVYIYGEGSKRKELEELLKEMRLTDRIHLPGNSSHIFDIMHTFEFFVMCSDYEGLSNALLEAMVSGMVCVTTAWNGVEEIVQDGVNGYLTPVGDAEALAEKLRTVLRADNTTLRQHSIETARAFCGDSIIQQWRMTINELTH